MLIEKKDILLERNEQGEPIARKVTLRKNGDKEVMIKPITRGRIAEILSNVNIKDKDATIVKEGLIEPKLTDEELKVEKPAYMNLLVAKIFEESGMSFKDTVKESYDEATAALKKK